MASDRSAGVQQGREYLVYVCPECGEQQQPPGHHDYAEGFLGAGHYHEREQADGAEEPTEAWVEAEQVRVVEAVSPEPREAHFGLTKQEARDLIDAIGAAQDDGLVAATFPAIEARLRAFLVGPEPDE